VDARSGLVHTVKITTGKVHDAKLTDDLIRPDNAIVFGDKGHVRDERKRAARARGATWAVKDKRKPGRVLTAAQKKRNKKHGGVRAKVEHVSRVIKCQVYPRKVRYRGLAKNEARMFSPLLGIMLRITLPDSAWRWPTSVSREDACAKGLSEIRKTRVKLAA